MSSAAHRFLGFGFAGADLLLELGPDGRVTFALGAGEAVMGVPDTRLADRPWKQLFRMEDHPMVASLFKGLDSGIRAGPVIVAISGPDRTERFASLTAIRLPQNRGAISCALSRTTRRAQAGIQTREAFEARAGELLAMSGQDLQLSFVELAGLSDAAAKRDDTEAVEAAIAGALRAQAFQGEAPAAIGVDRYALIRGPEESLDVLNNRLSQALNDAGVEGVAPQSAGMSMTTGTRPKQVAQALKYALNQLLTDGLAKPLPNNLSDAVNSAMRSTLDKAGQLGAAIRNKRFTLAYQPVVSLSDGSLHHHEVLVRFGTQSSPFPTIRMAEELDLIEPLDVAILEETLSVLRDDPTLTLAVNVSGRSIMSPEYMDHAVRMLREQPWAQGRLMFELTESAAVEDLAQADRHIQALRALKCEVCLDDFGAGAASLAYLQQLTLDLLKIDGRYIRDLQRGGREATFVKHLVAMCGELKVRTLAEMVETPETEATVREAGVDYAQGWLYGRASETPSMELEGGMGASKTREGPLSIRNNFGKQAPWG